MFRVFRVFKCSRVMTFRKIKRVTKVGGPKMAKISGGVKPDIFKRAAQMAKISGGVKIQDFGPPLRPKKCF